jgi:hypothetical protein
MSSTLTNIVSFVGIFTSIVAMIGLIIELRSSRLSLQTQTLLQLEERFYSNEMRNLRRIAARKIISSCTSNPELEDVLDFLHSIVMLVERGVIDKKLALEFYKYWIARYWLAAANYIETVRQTDDPHTYHKLEQLAVLVIKENHDVNYSSPAMIDFLHKEAEMDETTG